MTAAEEKSGASTAYCILFLQGLGNLFPWNTFITASHYFNMRFCGQPFQTGFENSFSVVTMLSQVCGLCVSIRFLEKVPLKWCVLGPVAVSLAVMMVSTALVTMPSLSPHVVFATTILSCGLFGVNSAISGGAIFGLSGSLPPEYTGAVMCGQGMGGVVVALASIASLWVSPVHHFCPSVQQEQEQEQGESACEVTVDNSALMFFLACCGVLLLCLASFVALMLLPFTRFHQERVATDLLRGMSLDDLHTLVGGNKERDRGLEEGVVARYQSSHNMDTSTLVSHVHGEGTPLLPDRGTGAGSAERNRVRSRGSSGGSSGDWCLGSVSGEQFTDPYHYRDDLYQQQRGEEKDGYDWGGCELVNCAEGENPLTEDRRQGVSGDDSVANEGVAHHHNTSFRLIIGQIRPAASSLFLTLLITLLVFPSHTVLLRSAHHCAPGSSRWHNDLFTPLLFLLFYIADFLGRALPAVTRLGITTDTLWRPVCMRLLLLPPLLLCRVDHSYLPTLLPHDIFPALLLFLFGLSNGFLSTLAMMLGPAMVSPRKAPIAGEVMVLALNLGLLCGSVLSFGVLLLCTGNTQ